MKIFNFIQDFRSAKKTVVTIGTFDGVHVGHRKIIERLIQSTDGGQYESLVLTFFPHPRMVLDGNSEVKLLNTLEEKKGLLGTTGLDHLIIHPFDAAFAGLSAEAFVKTVLVEKLNVKKIIIGHDHRFGKNRSADIKDLMLFGEQYGFEVEQIPVQEINAVSVSSTKIRKALDDGNVALANEYLGYDYFLTGTISKGKQLGRTIGFPTANLKIAENYKLIPKIGVYVAKSIIDGITVYGMMNIGMNPTVKGKDLSVEIHYFNFDKDLYGREICVSLLERIRDEEKFGSVDLLKAQLQKDKITALSLVK